jgi:hypothetical protein
VLASCCRLILPLSTLSMVPWERVSGIKRLPLAKFGRLGHPARALPHAAVPGAHVE